MFLDYNNMDLRERMLELDRMRAMGSGLVGAGDGGRRRKKRPTAHNMAVKKYMRTHNVTLGEASRAVSRMRGHGLVGAGMVGGEGGRRRKRTRRTRGRGFEDETEDYAYDVMPAHADGGRRRKRRTRRVRRVRGRGDEYADMVDFYIGPGQAIDLSGGRRRKRRTVRRSRGRGLAEDYGAVYNMLAGQSDTDGEYHFWMSRPPISHMNDFQYGQFHHELEKYMDVFRPPHPDDIPKTYIDRVAYAQLRNTNPMRERKLNEDLLQSKYPGLGINFLKDFNKLVKNLDKRYVTKGEQAANLGLYPASEYHFPKTSVTKGRLTEDMPELTV